MTLGRAWRSGALVVLGLAALTLGLVFHARYAFDGLALFDVGIVIDGALRTLDGELFAADFIAPYGPLRYWIVAAGFASFGASLKTWCWLALSIQSLAGAGLMLVATRTATIGAALGVFVGVSIAHGAFHKCFLALAAVMVMAAFAWVLPRERSASRIGVIGGGVLFALAFLLRYDTGAFAGVALMAASAWRREHRRGVIPVAAVAVGVVLPVVALLWAAGAEPGSWWEATQTRIATQERIDVPFPWPGTEGVWDTPGRAALASSLWLAPAVHAILLLGVLRRRGRDGDDGFRVAVALFGLLLLNQARLVPSVNHLFQALPPVFVALADLCGRRDRARWVPGHLALAALLLGLGTWVARADWGTHPAAFSSTLRDPVDWDDPRAGIRLERDEVAFFRMTISAIQESVPDGGALATGPQCALFAFLADRRPASPYAEPSYYYGEESRQAEVAEEWDRSAAPAVVFLAMEPRGYLSFQDDAPVLWRSLLERYRPFETHGRFAVWVRRGSR